MQTHDQRLLLLKLNLLRVLLNVLLDVFLNVVLNVNLDDMLHRLGLLRLVH